MIQHEKYMYRCIELALKGAGSVAPNPMVGAVLVHKDRIIGEGFHEQFGGHHAEVNCIHSVCEKDKSSIKEATLYVSLEPCSHHGKTPPCTNLIVAKQIKHVVIGTIDPFSAVNGSGINILKNTGVRVEVGVLQNECRQLNQSFFTFHEQSRPFIILKWAQTANAIIANEGNERLLITNDLSNRMVHRWRSMVSAILIGTNTAMKDNPSLSTRLWYGKSPIRLVIDLSLKLPSDLLIFTDGLPTIIFNYHKAEKNGLVEYVQLMNNNSVIYQIIDYCYTCQYNCLMVEGGAQVLQSFIDASLWDEARVITNQTKQSIGGIKAPLLMQAEVQYTKQLLDDILVVYTKNNE